MTRQFDGKWICEDGESKITVQPVTFTTWREVEMTIKDGVISGQGFSHWKNKKIKFSLEGKVNDSDADQIEGKVNQQTISFIKTHHPYEEDGKTVPGSTVQYNSVLVRLFGIAKQNHMLFELTEAPVKCGGELLRISLALCFKRDEPEA
jgi:hypothetical protein